MEEDQLLEIPSYYLCPITLQIMKDPVTTITGITYDRHSIQKWISNTSSTSFPPLCPVTNQPLLCFTTRSNSNNNNCSDYLIPNHTLRRLIHQWSCTEQTILNTPNGTSCVLDESQVMKLMRVLEKNENVGTEVFLASLTLLEGVLGSGVEMIRVLMARSDVPKLMLELIVKCSMKCLTECMIKCLVIFNGVWSVYHPTHDFEIFVEQNGVDLINVLLSYAAGAGHHSLLALRRVIKLTSFNQLQLLNKDFFSKMVKLLIGSRKTSTTIQVQVLHILVHLCSNARDRTNIMEAGTVEAVIELQLRNPPTHKITADLIFNILSLLCHYVEGRERFLSHPCALGLLAELLLRVSPVVDERILEIISLISKLSGRKDVVTEMLQVGVVSKLCMAMQSDCSDYLKAKIRKVLRMHWSSWNGSPCISLYLIC